MPEKDNKKYDFAWSEETFDIINVSKGAAEVIDTCMERDCGNIGVIRLNNGLLVLACTADEDKPVRITKESVAKCEELDHPFTGAKPKDKKD